MTKIEWLCLIIIVAKRMEDSKIVYWNRVPKYFFRVWSVFPLSAFVFGLSGERDDSFLLQPLSGSRQKELWRILEADFLNILFFLVTQNVDWAILSCLLSAWFIPCSSTWKKGFLFCFFAGFGLSGMLCICFSKLNLLTKVEKQLAHKYPSIMLLFPWLFKIYFSFFTNRTLL